MKKKQLLNKVGSIAIKEKDGKEKLYELVYWNAVQRCNPDSCGCIELCGNIDSGKPCHILSSYMGGVFDLMIRTFPGNISEDVVYRIGMHLVPLYKILCRLKMQEYSEDSVFLQGKMGRSINPIFEEIRKTIKQIEDTWKNLGYIVTEGRKLKKDRFAGYFNERSYYDVIENGGMPMLEEMNSSL
jgi:hypothetical protein